MINHTGSGKNIGHACFSSLETVSEIKFRRKERKEKNQNNFQRICFFTFKKFLTKRVLFIVENTGHVWFHLGEQFLRSSLEER